LRNIFLALFVIVIISAVSVASFASPETITNTSSQMKYGSLTYMYYETSSGPGTSTPSTNTGTIPSGSSGSYSLAASSTAYLWSSQFASATTISAGNWLLDLWGSAAVVADVPITISNNQSSATPNPFQVKITWNPSNYASYEASDLGNIRFYSDSAFSQPLNAWLESCTPSLINSATSATAWVKLTNSINPNGGTLKIYMGFLTTGTEFDGNYWGDSPDLSSTYGQYDNGAKVFSFYDNFAGTTLSSKWTKMQGSSGSSITVNNGLNVTITNASTAYGFVISQNQTYPAVAEAYASSGDSILGLSTTTNLNGFIAPYNGYSMDWYAGNDYMVYESSSGGANLASPAQSSYPTGIWQVAWNATGSEYFQDGKGLNYTGTNNGASIANYAIYIGQSNGVAAINLFRWARMRAFPPNNQMPSASVGVLTSPKYVAGISIYVTDASGNILTTVANNVTSPNIGASESQISMTMPGSQVNVPQNSYIGIEIFATSTPYTIYWGKGQPTNFQVPYRVLSGA